MKLINNDILGTALIDYISDNYTEDIITYSSVSGEDIMELPWLFRSYKEMPLIEQTALKACYGKVLDVGCGAGSHSLYLQKKGFTVTAIDSSKGAIETCIKRGVKHAKIQDVWHLKNKKFDTLLVLMNGTGLCGKLERLEAFLIHLKSLLTKNGQILIDSSDIIYMYNKNTHLEQKSKGLYYGEVLFEMTYKNNRSKPFDWLFVNFDVLKSYAVKAGLQCENLKKGFHYDYLAKLYVSC